MTPEQPLNVDQILQEREHTHGPFPRGAAVMQKMKAIMRDHPNWPDLAYDQKEALEMICHKMGRIINGNPNTHDHWADMAGYSTLVANRLK